MAPSGCMCLSEITLTVIFNPIFWLVWFKIVKHHTKRVASFQCLPHILLVVTIDNNTALPLPCITVMTNQRAKKKMG